MSIGPDQRLPYLVKLRSSQPRLLPVGERFSRLAPYSFLVLATTLAGCVEAKPAASISMSDYRTFEVEAASRSGARGTRAKLEADLARKLNEALAEKDRGGKRPAMASKKVAILRSHLISCELPTLSGSTNIAVSSSMCTARATLMDKQEGLMLTEFVVSVAPASAESVGQTAVSEQAMISGTLTSLAKAIVGRVVEATAPGHPQGRPTDKFKISGNEFGHHGDGIFKPIVTPQDKQASPDGGNFSLKKIRHDYDPNRDRDVPHFTDVTLNDRVPPLIDQNGKPYALLTLYNVDPPLDGLPSREPGIDRGIDFRDPANLIKATYSNYVSPVFTLDQERRPVAGHPIGHFYVKLQIPGYPTILTGMTTIKRADDELVDLTLGRQLGIGGVLMTPQPGRLNSAAEALEELTLRQRKLIVIDGVRYRRVRGPNVGPTYVINDGNITFARFKLPLQNGKDALKFFLEYVDRKVHNTFGSILNRPHRGTGAGCAAFAMAWLKASGVIPVVEESLIERTLDGRRKTGDRDLPFWMNYYRKIYLPWAHFGCDDRTGPEKPMSAQYTIYDLLFYRETDESIMAASGGLAEKIRKDVGTVGATLFQFGAFTPLRSLFINIKRKDPDDRGDYRWGQARRGLPLTFGDNRLFSRWATGLWANNPDPRRFKPVREGRFIGVEVDAMDVPRQANDFFAMADKIAEIRKQLQERGIVATSCRSAIALGIH